MPEVDNFDESFGFIQSVIDPNGGMENFSNARTFRDGHADSGKILEKINVIKECCPKPFSGIGVIGANVIENDLQVD